MHANRNCWLALAATRWPSWVETKGFFMMCSWHSIKRTQVIFTWWSMYPTCLEADKYWPGLVEVGPPLNVCQATSEKSLEFRPMVPHVSIATGWNWYMWSRCAYVLVLSSSACAAAPPALWLLFDSVTGKKCRHLASHTRYFPCSQGTMVIPLGRFPSARCNPEGSSWEGIFAAVRVCWMTMLTVTWQPPLAKPPA